METNTYKIQNRNRKKYIRMDMNESNWGPSEKVLEAIRSVEPEDISVYPEYNKLETDLCKKLMIEKENLLLGNGSDEIISWIANAFLDEDFEVILPVPTFTIYRQYCNLRNASVREVEYNKDLSYPLDKVLSAVNEKTKMILVVNPNNPTGTTLDEAGLIRLLKNSENALVLLDEAYCQYAEFSNYDLFRKFPNLIVLQTFSKIFGMAGLRLGYAISSRENLDRLKLYRQPFSVNSLAVKAAEAVLQEPEFSDDIARKVKLEKQKLIGKLTELGFQVRDSDTNFVLVKTGLWTDEYYRALKRNGILVKNLKDYPLLQKYIRISVGRPHENDQLLDTFNKIKQNKTVIFDMDGVLVDVQGSYRQTIQQTASFYLGRPVTKKMISAYKLKGNCNNDWDLTQKILQDNGLEIGMDEIRVTFQKLLIGNNYDGLITNEKWQVNLDLLKRLRKKYKLAIVTGRPRNEALYTLKKYGVDNWFDEIITFDDIPADKQKPDPEGINMVLSRIKPEASLYIGDTIDDAIAATAAGITGIGCLKNYNEKVCSLFQCKGIRFLYSDVNRILEELV